MKEKGGRGGGREEKGGEGGKGGVRSRKEGGMEKEILCLERTSLEGKKEREKEREREKREDRNLIKEFPNAHTW